MSPAAVRAPLRVEIPGRRALVLRHLLLDLNGTIAEDGRVLASVRRRLPALAEILDVHVLTADTFGTAAAQLARLPVRLEPVTSGRDKARIARALGREAVVAVGNGTNDVDLLRLSALSIAVVGAEGAAGPLLAAAHVVVVRIDDALDLLLRPRRLVATLRP